MTNPKYSKPLLYYDDLNPHSRGVLMLLKLLDVDVELKFVNTLKGEHLTPTFLHINPAHTLPVMVHQNIIITDSHAILMYICDNFSGEYSRQLLPENCYKKRLRIYNRLFFEGTVLFRRHGELMTDLIRKSLADTDISFHEKKVKSAYDALEVFLQGSPYMAGSTLTIADLAIVATVGALDMMYSISEDRSRWHNLYDWHKRMKAMAVHKVNFNGIEKQREVVEMYGRFEFPSTVKRRSTAAVRASQVPRLTLSQADRCSDDEDEPGEAEAQNKQSTKSPQKTTTAPSTTPATAPATTPATTTATAPATAAATAPPTATSAKSQQNKRNSVGGNASRAEGGQSCAQNFEADEHLPKSIAQRSLKQLESERELVTKGQLKQQQQQQRPQEKNNLAQIGKSPRVQVTAHTPNIVHNTPAYGVKALAQNLTNRTLDAKVHMKNIANQALSVVNRAQTASVHTYNAISQAHDSKAHATGVVNQTPISSFVREAAAKMPNAADKTPATGTPVKKSADDKAMTTTDKTNSEHEIKALVPFVLNPESVKKPYVVNYALQAQVQAFVSKTGMNSALSAAAKESAVEQSGTASASTAEIIKAFESNVNKIGPTNEKSNKKTKGHARSKGKCQKELHK